MCDKALTVSNSPECCPPLPPTVIIKSSHEGKIPQSSSVQSWCYRDEKNHTRTEWKCLCQEILLRPANQKHWFYKKKVFLKWNPDGKLEVELYAAAATTRELWWKQQRNLSNWEKKFPKTLWMQSFLLQGKFWNLSGFQWKTKLHDKSWSPDLLHPWSFSTGFNKHFRI